MAEVAIAFISGLLGSGHCIGMCGPFALALGAHATNWRVNAERQLFYAAGRIFTYGCAGLAAAFLGSRLRSQFSAWLSVQAVLSALAGVVLITQGLRILQPGWFIVRGARRTLTCEVAKQLRSILTAPGKCEVFLAGVATGFLPCALVYANLAIAASSAKPLVGASLMTAMGLGTVPLMFLTGVGGSVVKIVTRQRLIRCAACLIIATGCLSLFRATTYWMNQTAWQSSSCPMCFPKAK